MLDARRTPTASRTIRPVDTDRFQLLSDLFERAAALAPEQREAFLHEHCGGDAALKAEVEALLGHSEKPDDPVVTAAGLDALFEEAGLRPRGSASGKIPDIIGRQSNQGTPHPLHNPATPTTVSGLAGSAAPMPLLTGQYRILRVVGEGGMGIVYEAEQSFPKRRVALKSIRPGLFSRRMLRRFQNEAHILGRLQHPGIAHIYEAGASDPQSPDDAFFVMEFVDGPPLTTYAEQKKLRTRERAELMIKVCDAVHHAHQRGVIHRDLKPGNILVTEDADGTPRPKILDFGVARVTDDRTKPGDKAHAETMLTHAGQLIGTLAYMSPEQISAGPDDVDVRTDVYALGVVLYQLLTGKLPLDLADKSIPDAVQMVREHEPSRLGTIDRAFRGDLETIVAKALEKDRARRYQSAAELGEDLGRYLAGEAIAAKRDSAMYVLRKQVKRHKAAVAIAAIILVGLVAFGIVASMQARRNRMLAETLADQLVIANTDRGRLESLGGTPYLGERTLWTERLQRPDIPETYWALWEHYARQPILRSTSGPGLFPGRLVMTPDRQVVIRTGREGEIQAWSSDLEKCLWRTEPEGTSCLDAAMAADGSYAVFVGVKGKILLLNPKTGAIVRRIDGGTAQYYAVAIAADSATFFTGDLAGEVVQWNAVDGTRIKSFPRFARLVRTLAISPDGSILVVGCLGGTCAVIDMLEGKIVGNLRIKASGVYQLTFSRDGERFYALMADATLHIFDTNGMGEVDQIEVGDARSMAFLNDRTVATCGSKGLRFWDLPTKTMSGSFLGDESGTEAIIPGPRPGTLMMSGMGFAMRLWETTPLTCAARLLGGTNQTVFSAQPSPDGTVVASTDAAGVVRLWDIATQKLLGQCAGPSGGGRSVAWRPGTHDFAAVFDKGDVAIFHAGPEGVAMVSMWKVHKEESCGAAFSADGGLLATSSQKDGIKIWNAETHELVRRLSTTQASVLGVEFSPDGKRVLSAGVGPGLVVSNVATGAVLAAIPDTFQNFRARYSPDGKTIAVANSLSEVGLLDAETLSVIRVMRGHSNLIVDVHFSTDGRMVVSGSADGTIRLWNVATGRSLATLELGGEVSWAAFVPGCEDRWIVTSGARGQVRLIDLRYYDRHIAGNTGYFLARLGPTLPTPAKTDELLRWARRASGNPGLTFDDPVAGLPMLPNGATNRAAPAAVAPSKDK
jgi:eukaryotic-like serine/threonine-protein kinase